MLRLAVLGSGRGSNFQAILNAIERGVIPDTRVALVISNNSDAGILSLARTSGIPALHLSQKHFPTEGAFAEAMLDALGTHDINLVVLAGYMKRVPARVVAAYRGKILNIHPALLPKYGGKGMYGHHVHEAVIASGDKRSGATVHIVDEEYDRGPIVLQREVDVLPGDTPETLSGRVLAVEHELYPDAIRLFASRMVPEGGGERHLTTRGDL